MSDQTKERLKHFLNFIPLIVFFVSYKLSPPQYKPAVFSTAMLMLAVIFSAIVSYACKIEIDKFNMYSNVAVVVFGILTILFNNPEFIKTKITVINLSISLYLLYNQIKRDPKIRHVFSNKIEMSLPHWLTFNKRLSIFFAFIAIANELIWFFLSEEMWVYFKVFGVISLTLVFFIAHTPFFGRNSTVLQKIQK